MRMVTPLTDAQLRAAKPSGKNYLLFDGNGLALEVFVNGEKFWRFRYPFGGRQRKMSLGRYPEVSLKQARLHRDELRRKLAVGIDPMEERKRVEMQAREREAALANTFEKVALEWMDKHLASKSRRHFAKVSSILRRFAFPLFGSKPIAEVESADILAAARVSEAGGHLETAHTLLQVASQVFRYAIALGLVKYDIARDLHAAIPRQEVKHRAILESPVRIGQVLRLFDNYGGGIGVKYALRLLPFLMVRPGELCAAEWAELDLAAAQWRIPAAKMKMRKAHIVPLAVQVRAVLEELRLFTGGGKYVFPSERSGRHITVEALEGAMKSMGIAATEITPHGWRGTASTWLNGHGFNRDWIEKQLAHVESDSVRAAYNHADYLKQRVEMMQAWADYLEGLRNEDNQA